MKISMLLMVIRVEGFPPRLLLQIDFYYFGIFCLAHLNFPYILVILSWLIENGYVRLMTILPFFIYNFKVVSSPLRIELGELLGWFLYGIIFVELLTSNSQFVIVSIGKGRWEPSFSRLLYFNRIAGIILL